MSDVKTVAVIGAGPGGYVCAIRLAQLGFKTTIIDQWVDDSNKPLLGGTCLNVGCIPSKALLESSHLFHTAQHEHAIHGIKTPNVSVDLPAMLARKDTIVSNFTQGVLGLLKANNVEVLTGTATLHADKTIYLNNKKHQAYNAIVLATGSTPIELPFAKFDHSHIVDSSGALCFQSIPKKLGIIGAGVIGLELGSVWARLGSDVTIFEALPNFLPMADHTIAAQALKEFTKQKLNIALNTKVNSVTKQKNSLSFTLENNDTYNCDALIVAVGRKPNSNNLLDPSSGLTAEKNGSIAVNEFCQTSVPNVYAIGDLVRGPMLAHKASHEGIQVAEVIAQKPHTLNLNHVPSVIYTYPEMAWVGDTENTLKANKVPYHLGTFPFAALGRAAAQNTSTGSVKIISHQDTDAILGVHIFGPGASELIATATTAINFEASAEDLAHTITAHPTLSEALHEAALDTSHDAIHVFRKKKKL